MASKQQGLGKAQFVEIQTEFGKIYQELQKTEQDMQQLVASRQRLVAQQNENKMVKEEMDKLDKDKDAKKVYKLIGPALVQQDLLDAKQTVDKRLDFLQKEVEKVDKSLKEKHGEQEKRKGRLMEIQTMIQQSGALNQQQKMPQ